MKKLTIIGLISTFALLLSVPSKAAMNPYVEKALQNICNSSLSNQPTNFKRVVKSYRLSLKAVADKVVCDGDDIGTFAAENGAVKTANYIRSMQKGSVEIQEIASL